MSKTKNISVQTNETS